MTDAPRPPMQHHRAAITALESWYDEPMSDGEAVATATIALAHATMLVANETRIANLIAYLGLLRISGDTPDAAARMQILEQRIDDALGTHVEGAPRA